MLNHQQTVATQEKFIIHPAESCLVVALLCNFLILLSEPLKNNTIGSLGARGLIIALFGFALFQLINVIKNSNTKNAYYFIAILVAALISAFFSGPTAILKNLVQLVCFFMLPISILLYKSVYNVEFAKKTIYLFNFLYTILWTILSFSSLSHVFYGEYGKETIDSLTLGYANPNQTGMFLMISFIIALSASQYENGKVYQIVHFIQSIWTAFLIIQTQSRTCIILMIIILILWLLKRIDKINNAFIAFCFILPAAMAVAFLLGGERIQEWIILEEEFGTGRVYLIQKVVKDLSFGEFLFGDFSKWIGNNLHNSYFTIFAIFGIVGFVAYIIFLWKTVQDYFKQVDKKSHSSMIAFLGVLVVIVHGATEAALLTSGMVYASLVSLLFILTLNEEQNK